MRNLVFVVRSGPLKNLTLSSIKFDYYGTKTNYSIIECQDWPEGFDSAKNQGYEYGLFIDSGTVFENVLEFFSDLANYPHQGLVGHIIDHKDGTFSLHPQAFLLELSKFNLDDFLIKDFDCSVPKRSEADIHDDYTPIWLQPSDKKARYTGKNFGERLIAQQLNQGRTVVNFKQILRKNKKYLYTKELVDAYLKQQENYFSVAENQLWIFNNEEFVIKETDHLICPASGLYWIFHAIKTQVETVDLVDISNIQLDFAMELWLHWSGENYGQFTYDFIREHRVRHFLVDNVLGKTDLIQLLKSGELVNTINQQFEKECAVFGISNFKEAWTQARKRVTVLFHNQDLLEYLKNHNAGLVWMSNILDYKYTLLKHYD